MAKVTQIAFCVMMGGGGHLDLCRALFVVAALLLIPLSARVA
jgi:hypothetical protein